VILELIAHPTHVIVYLAVSLKTGETSRRRGTMVYSGMIRIRDRSLMPAEITNIEEFVGLSETAHECRVKRSKDFVKLKLRTPSQLYTHKVKIDRADDVIKRLKCEIVEV
jgi:large subunit ribosomal protein L38e